MKNNAVYYAKGIIKCYEKSFYSETVNGSRCRSASTDFGRFRRGSWTWCRVERSALPHTTGVHMRLPWPQCISLTSVRGFKSAICKKISLLCGLLRDVHLSKWSSAPPTINPTPKFALFHLTAVVNVKGNYSSPFLWRSSHFLNSGGISL